MSAVPSLLPADLRCENRVDPLGVDAGRPALGWIVCSSPGAKGRSLSAYQILAGTSPDRLSPARADLWNSGRVRSAETLWRAYAGKELHSFQQAFWKVRVWDQDGVVSPWSSVAQWTEGIVRSQDWGAHWIAGPILPKPVGSEQVGPASRCFRREFEVPRTLRRALLSICGLGQYEARINDRKVGDAVLAPGWTDYRKRCLYDTYDVTSLVHGGANAVGILLGNGMYNVVSGRYSKFTGTFGPTKVICQLRMEYADGSISVIGSNAAWKTAAGPITFSSPYGGEDFDGRLEQTGWARAGFRATGWTGARETEGPGGTLYGTNESSPPVRLFERLKSVREWKRPDGSTIYDMGQNASLMPQLTVQGERGATVRVTPSELVSSDGSLDRRSVGSGPAYWQWTLGHSGSSNLFPKFFYHGSRYLQVETGAPLHGRAPTVTGLECRVVHSDSAPAGRFHCSNPLFNRVFDLIEWAQKNNLVSVITDCPHRERLGWLEQTHLNGPALRYDFDLTNLFAKVVGDMQDAQLTNGCVPDIAPEFVNFGSGPDDLTNPFRNSPEWGSAAVLIPWQQYEFSGDIRLLKSAYQSMSRYVRFLRTQSKAGIVDFGLGDWYDLGPNPPGFSQLTPRDLTATAFYYLDASTVAKAAEVLGRGADRDRFLMEAQTVRAAFKHRFYHPESRTYASGSQCGNAIALSMGLVESSQRSSVLQALVTDVERKGLTAGDVGYRYVLRALADGGRSDLVVKMNNQSDRPGYGFQLKMGATSLTEAWDAGPTSSQDHFMLGQLAEWFYHDAAGIQNAPNSAGFHHIVIRPALNCGLSSAAATYQSVRGPIHSSWELGARRSSIEVSIPPNTDAWVELPKRFAVSPIEAAQTRIRTVEFKGQLVRMSIGSGTYRFKAGMETRAVDLSTHATRPSITLPYTSVRRKSLPAYR